MRKLITLFMLFLVIAFSFPVKASDFYILHCPGPGLLQIPDDAYLATKLKVTGHLDARDFATLKLVTICRTRELDLSEIVIESYQGKHGSYEPPRNDHFVDEKIWYHEYAANTLPIHAFTEMRYSFYYFHAGSQSLTKLILPASLQNIEDEAMKGCNALSQIIVPKESLFFSGDNVAIFNKGQTKLLYVAPGYRGNLNIPQSITTIAKDAFNGSVLACVTFNSNTPPAFDNSSSLNAACIACPDALKYSKVFPKIDCFGNDPQIEINCEEAGTLNNLLTKQGFYPSDVRNIKITGKLGESDIDLICGMKNLHQCDISSAQLESPTYIKLTSRVLYNFKFPPICPEQTQIWISSECGLIGDVNIPEGVWWPTVDAKGIDSLTMPSTFKYERASFEKSYFKKVDFSKCLQYVDLLEFENCSNLETLLLPESIMELKITLCPLEKLNLPKELYSLSLYGLDLTSLSLPSSLVALRLDKLPCLKKIDIPNNAKLKYIIDFTYIPQIESLDFSNTMLSQFGTLWKRAVSTGGSSYSDLPITFKDKLKSIKFPPTLESLCALVSNETITSLDISQCYRLKKLDGIHDCSKLQQISLPASSFSTKSELFENCPNLKSIRIAAHEPPTIPVANESTDFIENVTLYVPNNSSRRYISAPGWNRAENIIEDGFVVNIVDSDKSKNGMIYGSGLYKPNEVATISYKTLNQEKSTYILKGWNTLDGHLDGQTVNIPMTSHQELTPVFIHNPESVNDGDICITFETSSDTVFFLDTKFESSYDAIIFNQNEVLGNIDNSGYNLSLKKGKNTIAINGNPLELSLGTKDKCTSNIKITKFTVNNGSLLKRLSINNLHLQNIVLNNCSVLEELDVEFNDLKEINLGGCPNLKNILCGSNQLKDIEVSGRAALEYVDVLGNRLTEYDCSNCPNLYAFRIDYNKIKLLNFTNCPRLRSIYGTGNELTEIDVRNVPLLTNLFVERNSIQSLDLSENHKLKWLYADKNRLKTLKIAEDATLEGCSFSYNPVAYSVITDQLYSVITSNGTTDVSYKFICEDLVDENGILDLSSELTASNGSPTDIRISYNISGEEIIGKNGHYELERQGGIILKISNKTYPALTYEGYFYNANPTAISDLMFDKSQISIRGKVISVTGLSEGTQVELIGMDGTIHDTIYTDTFTEYYQLEAKSTGVYILNLQNGSFVQSIKLRLK